MRAIIKLYQPEASRSVPSYRRRGCPFIVMLTRRASPNAASVQSELRNNDLILRDYGHLPSVDERSGRVVVVGDGLHADGLMARLKHTGILEVLEFPLLREGDGAEIERCTWRAEYPTQEAIDRRRDALGDIGFHCEMPLQVVPEQGQDVLPADIHHYDDPPFDDRNHLAHGVDLAISTKESADYTAIVSGEVRGPGGNVEISVQPNSIRCRELSANDGAGRQAG